MSYDESTIEKKTCPCGNGHIFFYSSSNDWNQHKRHAQLVCPACSAKYHIEEIFSYRNGLSCARYVLVPNGETLSSELPIPNIYTTPIPEQLCYRYTYTQLQNIATILSNTTSCSSVKDTNAKKVISICRASTGSAKINAVKTIVAEALALYYQLPINFEIEQSRIAAVKRHIIELV